MKNRHDLSIEINYRLVADIGGTRARFSLLHPDGQLVLPKTLNCSNFEDIASAITYYLDFAGNPHVEESAIAIANPVHGDKVKMTNHHWSFSVEHLRQRLKFKSLIIKNDLTALAMSIPELTSADIKQIGGQSIQNPKTFAVIAAGTGLGVSGLINAGEQWVPLESEGGHVSISPGNEFEIAILQYCMKQFEHVSAERLISGMGFLNLYNAVCNINGKKPQELSAVEISNIALSGSDRLCELTVDTFCGLLGSVAGNLVLTLGAFDGIYIGGGIVPSLGNYFETSEFRERLESKGRFKDQLQQVPAYIIHKEYPALLGISAFFDSAKQQIATGKIL